MTFGAGGDAAAGIVPPVKHLADMLRQLVWVALALGAGISLIVFALTMREPFGVAERVGVLMVTAFLVWAALRVRGSARRRP